MSVNLQSVILVALKNKQISQKLNMIPKGLAGGGTLYHIGLI